MINRNKKALIAAVVGILLVGFFAGTIANRQQKIIPSPLKDRSKLKFIGRAARTVLWFMLLGEAKQEEASVYVHRHDVAGDENLTVLHSEGW